MLLPVCRPLLGLARRPSTAVVKTGVRIPADQPRRLKSNAAEAYVKKATQKENAAFGKQFTDQRRHGTNIANVEQMMFLMPGTFIPVPFSKLPKSPSKFFKYQYQSVKARLLDFFGTFGLRWTSKPSFFTRPRAQLYRSKALAAGKALHARLGQTLADGDTTALREIAMPRLQNSLSATLARRDPRERTTWQILRNHGARIVAHRSIILPPPFPEHMLIEQAVVAVDSTQKLERFDARSGEPVPGSARVQRRVEYVALHRSWDTRTYQPRKWLLLGNAKETTPEEWDSYKEREASQQDETVQKKIKQVSETTKS